MPTEKDARNTGNPPLTEHGARLFSDRRRTVLFDPAVHVSPAPDAARSEFASGLREALDPRELVSPLLTDAQKGGYLGDSYKLHLGHCIP